MATQALTSAPGALQSRSLTDRRTFLVAVPSVAMAASLPAVALAMPPANRSTWNAAMQAHTLAKAEDDAFTPVYMRIYEGWQAGRPSIDRIHWREFPFVDRERTARSLDLDEAWSDFLAGEGKWWSASDPTASKAKYRAALDSVQAFRDAEASHDRDSGMDAAEKRWEALADLVNDAQLALMNLPAPDLAALRWKLDQIFDAEEGGSISAWSETFVRQTMADYRRLMAEA